MNLQHQILSYCQKHDLLAPQDTIVVGLSGGPDSLCLLAILQQMASTYPLTLHVAHLNHHLRGQEADDDARFVIDLVERWNLPLTVQEENVAHFAEMQQLSIETAARKLRYRFLGKVAQAVGAHKIAVGHQADDQAETVLMHFLRGAGLKGLRGMQPRTALEHEETTLNLIRPLLEVSKTQIEAYCTAHKLMPRLDSSNQDLTFRRNRIRHELLPILESYNPNITQILCKMADLIQEDYLLLETEIQRAWHYVLVNQGPYQVSFDRLAWLALPLATQRGLLRQAVEQLCHTQADLTFDQVHQALDLIAMRHSGAQIHLPHHLTLTLEYQTIILATPDYQVPWPDGPYLVQDKPLPLNLNSITPLPQTNWVIQTQLLTKESLPSEELTQSRPWSVYLDAEVVGDKPHLRPRQPGDKFYPLGLNGRRQKVKDTMINAKIPQAWRDHIPLLISEGEQICWLCGYRLDHRCRVTEKTQQVIAITFRQVS